MQGFVGRADLLGAVLLEGRGKETMRTVLGTLRRNVTEIPFSVVKDHFDDLDVGVETILLIQKGYDLPKITAALYEASCQRVWGPFLLELLYCEQVKIVVHAPYDMPIDLWPFYLGTFDVPSEQRCRALYLKPVYFVQLVDGERV